MDAHTAHHLYHESLKGDLLAGRTVILVSHHVQLCAPGAAYVVALDQGQATFAGDGATFRASDAVKSLGEAGSSSASNAKTQGQAKSYASVVAAKQDVDEVVQAEAELAAPPKGEQVARKFVEEETREVGHIKNEVWMLLINACGGYFYWIPLVLLFVSVPLSRLGESAWIKCVASTFCKPPSQQLT